MSAAVQHATAPVLTAPMLERFGREVAKYPQEQRQSAVMACLTIVQAEWGWVSREAENLVADYLGMPPIAVHYEETALRSTVRARGRNGTGRPSSGAFRIAWP